MKGYAINLEIAATANEVFNRILDVSKWWGGKDLQGNTTKLNDEFIINHPGAHYSKQQLVELVPDQKVVWLVTESTMGWLKKDQHEWKNTRMIFELMPKEYKTVLHFTHEGLVPEKECYALCLEGWNTVIKDYLFHFITENKPHFWV